MLRSILIVGIALASLFCQQATAISSIQIQVSAVDAPAGQLKNAQFQVDLKGSEPTLNLHAEVRPTNERKFTPFDLKCERFNTAQNWQSRLR